MATPEQVDIHDLESEVNDLADMAELLATYAEKCIDIPPRPKPEQLLDFSPDQRKAVMYGLYQVASIARDLRTKYYAALEAEKAS